MLWLGFWHDQTTCLGALYPEYSAAVETRQLSAVSMQRGLRPNTTIDIRLAFEKENGNVTVVRGVHTDITPHNGSIPGRTPPWSGWEWNDTSAELYSSRPESSFNVPISLSEEWDDIYNVSRSRLFFTNIASKDGSRGEGSYNLGQSIYRDPDRSTAAMLAPTNVSKPPSQGWSTGELEIISPENKEIMTANAALERSDLVTIRTKGGTSGSAIGFWVQNNSLGHGIFKSLSPTYDFPFARLATASTGSANNVTFLYHQIDASTFAQEEWDADLGDWLPGTNISV